MGTCIWLIGKIWLLFGDMYNMYMAHWEDIGSYWEDVYMAHWEDLVAHWGKIWWLIGKIWWLIGKIWWLIGKMCMAQWFI